MPVNISMPRLIVRALRIRLTGFPCSSHDCITTGAKEIAKKSLLAGIIVRLGGFCCPAGFSRLILHNCSRAESSPFSCSAKTTCSLPLGWFSYDPRIGCSLVMKKGLVSKVQPPPSNVVEIALTAAGRGKSE